MNIEIFFFRKVNRAFIKMMRNSIYIKANKEGTKKGLNEAKNKTFEGLHEVI
jgi:hypothetical protein